MLMYLLSFFNIIKYVILFAKHALNNQDNARHVMWLNLELIIMITVFVLMVISKNMIIIFVQYVIQFVGHVSA